MAFWGQNNNERYPAGTPMGGRFKPKTYTLPLMSKPTISSDELLKQKYKKHEQATVLEFKRNNMKSLTDSLEDLPQLKQEALDSGISEKEIAKINALASDHAAKLLLSQARIRPKILSKLSEYELAWDDFGDFPAQAMVDHKLKQIVLNPKRLLNNNSKYTKNGEILESITHEMTHQIDVTIGGGDKAAFTELFKPLHEFISDYQENIGPTKWMIDTNLAYPSSGIFGTVKEGYNLPEEYSAVISEMFWHKPKQLDALDRHFAEMGFPGPSMREICQVMWGVDNNKSGIDDRQDIDKTIISKDSLGSRARGGVIKWNPTYSIESPLRAISF